MKTRSYSELRRFDTFDERFNYLKLEAHVGHSTFGFDRYINQRFYSSYEWKRAREQVILRDSGCDLGILGYDIHADLLVHHVNPMVPQDVMLGLDWIFDPEYLVLTTKVTHNAIHYGNPSPYPKVTPQRQQGDTKLW